MYIQFGGVAVTKKVIDFEQARIAKKSADDADILDYFLNLPPTLTSQQCVEGRAMLEWSQEALAFRSGASIQAIQEFEAGSRALKRVTKQALTFAMEAEGLIFIPNASPMKGENCRGVTSDPRLRDDFHQIE